MVLVQKINGVHLQNVSMNLLLGLINLLILLLILDVVMTVHALLMNSVLLLAVGTIVRMVVLVKMVFVGLLLPMLMIRVVMTGVALVMNFVLIKIAV